MATMTRDCESIAPTACLLLAFELGQRTWKLGFSAGLGQRPRIRHMPAGAIGGIDKEIIQAKMRLGLSLDAPVISCYEAGRDGFWLHRYLVAHGITNHVVDSASIEVNRRARRAKTDRLDLSGLLSLLARYQQGDRRVWRVVRVPTVAEEDARQLPRTWETLAADRTRLINRIKGLLMTQGVQVSIDHDFLKRLRAARVWDGTPIPTGLQERLTQDWAQLRHVEAQLRERKARATRRPPDADTPTGHAIAHLQTLRGIGLIGAWVLATEIFGWRQIANRRQLGGLVGLVPAPYQSGETAHDQGITRAGNTRRMMVQLAWLWLQHQPESTLAQWYQRRFGAGGKRLRRIGIVALARKLLIALWRYLETGDGSRRGTAETDRGLIARP
jgi:transposase